MIHQKIITWQCRPQHSLSSLRNFPSGQMWRLRWLIHPRWQCDDTSHRTSINTEWSMIDPSCIFIIPCFLTDSPTTLLPSLRTPLQMTSKRTLSRKYPSMKCYTRALPIPCRQSDPSNCHCEADLFLLNKHLICINLFLDLILRVTF